MMKYVRDKYRYSLILLREMVVTDFKLRYKGSLLGYLWTLLRPLALFAILYVVFAQFLRIGSDVPYFPVYLLLGIVFWNYFTEVTMGGVGAIVGRGELLRKLSFPRYVVVVSGSVSALINLALNLAIVLFFMVLTGVPFHLSSFLVIFPIIELFVFSLSLALILSALYVRFRDVNYIWEVVLQGGFYATPIIYPIGMVLEMSVVAAQVLMLSPIAQIIQDARYLLVTDQTQTIATIYGSSGMRLVPLAIVAVLAVVAVWYFKKRSPYFAEEI